MIIGSLQRLMVVPAVTLTFAIVFQLLSLESCVLLLLPLFQLLSPATL